MANVGIGRTLPIPAQVNAGDTFVLQLNTGNVVLVYDGVTWKIGRSDAYFDILSFGADPTGTNDSLAAFTSAFAAIPLVSAVKTARIQVPPGIYLFSNTLKIPTRVVIEGQHGRGVEFRPTAGFPANTPLVQIGPGTNNSAFNCRLENVYVNCLAIAQDGVICSEGQENSGASHVTVGGYLRYGFHLFNNGVSNPVQHTRWEDIEASADVTAPSTAIGFFSDATGTYNFVERISVGVTSGAAKAAGIRVTSGTLTIVDCHVESHTDGVHFGAGGWGTVIGFDGGATLTNAIHMGDAGLVTLVNVWKNGATNLIQDDYYSITDTNSYTELYAMGSTAASAGTYVAGRLLTPGLAPSIAAGAQAGSSPPTPALFGQATDQHGGCNWGTGTGAAAGEMVVITFNTTGPALRTGIVVLLTPGNSATAALLPYPSAIGTTKFSISLQGTPASSQGAAVYSCYWQVLASS